jgi:hypothetical protein
MGEETVNVLLLTPAYEATHVRQALFAAALALVAAVECSLAGWAFGARNSPSHLALIQRSAWKGNSAKLNFAFHDFSDVVPVLVTPHT